jgi:DNA repair exonuclease SbcCD ATPase subunit
MRLDRIRLVDFKRHRDLEIQPAAGLTIIRGPNEAGKSSIQEALELVLFRKADANRSDIRQAYPWGSDDPPEVTIDFEADGKSGTLRKRFGGGRSEAELTLDGKTLRDYTAIQDQIAVLTGIPTESFFRATASVGHAELDQVSGDEPVIRDRLQKAISGADRGTAEARKKLSAAIHRYRTEGEKNPGLLKVIREEIAMLEGELVDGDAALTRLEADRAAWVEANERREELDRQLTRLSADLAEAQRAEALLKRRDEARARYETLRRAVELEERADQLRAEMPTAIPLPQLRTEVGRATSLELELSELGADLDAEAATYGDEDNEPATGPPRPARWLGAGVALLVLAGAAWLLLGGILGAAVALILLVATVGVLVQTARVATRRRQYGLAQRLARTAASQRHEADRSRQERYRRQEREFESVLGTLGVADVATATALLETSERFSDELREIEGELRGLRVEERNVRRMQEDRDQAADQAERASHALAAMGKLAEDPVSARRTAERQLSQTTPARDEARSAADQAQGRVDANPVDAEIVAGLAERLAAARERYTELQRRVLVYQGTLDAIDAAEQATLKTAARYLEEHMGPSIAQVTDGRYDEIEVDEKNLAFTVRAPETGELVAVQQLSQGTADQLYLIARLGLVKLVTMDRRPPLILDDPFVTFDGPRGERALRLVKQVAATQGFQVLYLTCSNRFDALADRLVILEGPSSDRVLAEPARPPAHPAEMPQPTLRFDPDPRPNPDPVAPRQADAPAPPTAARETGVADPFRLGGGGAGD